MSATGGSSKEQLLRVAVVVVNYRTPELTLRCVQALERERASVGNLEVVVVDGGSADGSAEQLRIALSTPEHASWISFIPLSLNGGFGWANNQALRPLLQRDTPPEFIYLLNPDATIEAGAVRTLTDHLIRYPKAGAVGSQLLEPNGMPTGSAFKFPSLRGEFARGAGTAAIERLIGASAPSFPPMSEPCEVDWVTGASVMFRAEALRQSGVFDDGFFLYHEETELMWRLRRAGWSVWHEPRSRVRHVGGAATGLQSGDTKGQTFARRPAYWYQSRQRFFVRTRGRAYALTASLCWIGGHLLWRARGWLGLGSGKQFVGELRDQVRHSLAGITDQAGSDTDWSSQHVQRPAWMTK